MNQLTNRSRFWTITLFGVLACSLLFFLTNKINNFDELHYLSLAFEMHQQHYYLLPMTLGQPDIQKPPLLYWLINLGWSVFGMNTAWPLLLITLLNIGCLIATYCIAQQLFPEHPLTAQLAVIVLATGFFWFGFFNHIRFDGLLTLLTILYSYCAINIYRRRTWTWTLLAGLCLGLGFLAKGAAILVFALPFYLLLPCYETQHYAYHKWFTQFVLTCLIALCILLLWAIPLYHSLGQATLIDLFFTQQHSRLVLNHHWSELPNLLISFLPWAALPILWLNLPCLITQKINRHVLLLTWSVLLPTLFFTFCVVMHAKRYLLPLYPYCAILLAYTISLRINLKWLIIQNRILITLAAISGTGLMLLGFIPLPILSHVLPPSLSYSVWGGLLNVTALVAYFFNRHPTIKSAFSVLIGLIVAGLLVSLVGIAGVFTRTNDRTIQALTLQVQANQAKHIPQANLISGGYQIFAFKGRLPQPLPFFTNEKSVKFHNWMAKNPDGILYFSSRDHVRPCIASYPTIQLHGSNLLITIVSVKDYLASC